MIHITRRERFCSAHRLFNPAWTEEKNNEIFGGCANPNWHGHNYDLFVTVKGEIIPEFGYVMNLKDLSQIIRKQVTNKLDHRNLNDDVDFLKGVMTSTENVAIAIWNQLKPEIEKHGVQLHCVKLVETENNSVEYYG
jgi:6-pyruvoyltetrahydropterin/6-carboxytetrahydropterin synthase